MRALSEEKKSIKQTKNAPFHARSGNEHKSFFLIKSDTRINLVFELQFFAALSCL